MRIWFSLFLYVALPLPALAEKRPPNLIVIMADDIGVEELAWTHE